MRVEVSYVALDQVVVALPVVAGCGQVLQAMLNDPWYICQRIYLCKMLYYM